jgi:uncharacterized protein YabN with tetrapyrrole methylase and pyrophosphatase domain
MNPDRDCRLCGGKHNVKIRDLVSKYTGISHEQVKLEDIADEVDECPVCTLAVIRQSKLNKHPYDLQFDYKKSMEDWWAEVNKGPSGNDAYLF